jgi:uncharacterized protein (UPF0333 family)
MLLILVKKKYFVRFLKMVFGNFFERKGQGTIEYLIIIAIVVVIALVVVSTLVGFIESGSGANVQAQRSQLASQTIGVTETLVSSDGDFAINLLNNSGDRLTVTNVSVGDTNVNFSEDLAHGGSSFFKVSSGDVCEEGTVVTDDLVVTYVSSNGVTHVERYPSKVFFDCTPYQINQANLANMCPFAIELHSGQTTSYGTNPDDTDNDGTAKSYTDNGDGTVTDNQTNLVWQKDHKDDCAFLTWENALSYCSTLADSVDGLTDGSSAGDWRVPSFVELATLPDMSYPSSSYLNSVFTQTGWNDTCYGYWSSTTGPNSTSNAYYLDSGYGSIYGGDKTGAYSFFGVRCVRSE